MSNIIHNLPLVLNETGTFGKALHWELTLTAGLALAGLEVAAELSHDLQLDCCHPYQYFWLAVVKSQRVEVFTAFRDLQNCARSRNRPRSTYGTVRPFRLVTTLTWHLSAVWHASKHLPSSYPLNIRRCVLSGRPVRRFAKFERITSLVWYISGYSCTDQSLVTLQPQYYMYAQGGRSAPSLRTPSLWSKTRHFCGACPELFLTKHFIVRRQNSPVIHRLLSFLHILISTKLTSCCH